MIQKLLNVNLGIENYDDRDDSITSCASPNGQIPVGQSGCVSSPPNDGSIYGRLAPPLRSREIARSILCDPETTPDINEFDKCYNSYSWNCGTDGPDAAAISPTDTTAAFYYMFSDGPPK